MNSGNNGPVRPGRENILSHTRESIVRNRTVGFHFLDNFLGLTFAPREGVVNHAFMEAGKHCTDESGHVTFSALCVLADMALGRCVYAGVSRGMRLATISLQLQFSGARARGRLDAKTELHATPKGGASQQGLASISLRSANEEVCFGSGSFMVLDPPPGFGDKPRPPSAVQGNAAEAPPGFSDQERLILQDAEAALAMPLSSEESFFDVFVGLRPIKSAAGASSILQKRPQLSNRVGHVQGGILIGLAEITARAALPEGWAIQGITACYIRPGKDATLGASATVVHLGRRTAVVKCVISGQDGRTVLETLASYVATSA